LSYAEDLWARERIEGLERQVGSLWSSLRSLQSTVGGLEGSLAKLSDALAGLRAEIRSVDAAFRKRLEEVEGEVEATRKELLGQVEEVAEELSEGLSKLDQRIGLVSRSVEELGRSLGSAVRENREVLETLEQQMSSGLGSISGTLEKLVELQSSTLSKTAEINSKVAQMDQKCEQKLLKLLEYSEGIRAALDDVARGTLEVVRGELSNQTARLDEGVREVQRTVSTASDRMLMEQSRFLESVKQQLESLRSDVNRRLDELGGRVLATADDAASVVALLEALREDLNRALDTFASSLDLCCEKNLISKLSEK